jgi:hypothetical protein
LAFDYHHPPPVGRYQNGRIPRFDLNKDRVQDVTAFVAGREQQRSSNFTDKNIEFHGLVMGLPKSPRRAVPRLGVL